MIYSDEDDKDEKYSYNYYCLVQKFDYVLLLA